MAKCKFCDAEVQIGQICEYCGSRAERWYYTESEKMPVLPVHARRKMKETKYPVKKGDTLWHIAKRFYGTGSEWPKIAEANRLKNPNIIYPGDILIIPET